jgi:DNA-binding transcriptional ArsR family regulator
MPKQLEQPVTQERLDAVFHALACPARRSMVERLAHGSASVSDLAEPLHMALPSVLQHLGVLEDCGLVRSQKEGRVRTCHIKPARLDSAQGCIARQRAEWEARLDRFDDSMIGLQAKETPQ